ncbi:LysE family transporter [Candidatus Micrarchaeota archaeon]|nr:LysE family transporter [Candidatus Micrarchaeota archaeon]
MLEIVAFLIGVAAVTLSETMVPGPVTAVLVNKSHKNKYAGSLLTIGHVIIELPLILLIGLGLAQFLTLPLPKALISVAGGAMIFRMGYLMFANRHNYKVKEIEDERGILAAGIIATFSPYFFIWWATAGSILVISSLEFGIMGFVLFIIVHQLTDLAWYQALSYSIYKTNRFWNEKTYWAISVACGGFLMLFGLYFLYSAAGFLL